MRPRPDPLAREETAWVVLATRNKKHERMWGRHAVPARAHGVRASHRHETSTRGASAPQRKQRVPFAGGSLRQREPVPLVGAEVYTASISDQGVQRGTNWAGVSRAPARGRDRERETSSESPVEHVEASR